MVIRKRITDPYGSSEDAYRKFRKDGPPKAAPRKPSLEEREPFVRALKRVPMGATMDRHKFFRTVADVYSTKQFMVWGQNLYLWPRYQHLPDDRIKCTGVMVGHLRADARGRKATTIISDPDQQKWYGLVIHWLSETVYN